MLADAIGLTVPPPRITAIVLAAGRSARMGEPKPLLSIGGLPLLGRVLAAVRTSSVADAVLVLGYEADRVRSGVPTEGLTVLLNPDFEEGMSTSLRAGLRACTPDAEACVVILGDMPFLRAETIDALLHEYHRSPAKILVPTFRRRRGNPVLLQRSVWPEVEQLSGDLGFRAVFGEHSRGLHEVPVDDPGVLIDIDTVADLERVRRALENHEPLESLV